jgi:hypothetical protein
MDAMHEAADATAELFRWQTSSALTLIPSMVGTIQLLARLTISSSSSLLWRSVTTLLLLALPCSPIRRIGRSSLIRLLLLICVAIRLLVVRHTRGGDELGDDARSN